MRRNFYLKLALANIKRNKQTYTPYILSCIGTTAMFYIMHAISVNPSLDTIVGSESIKFVLNFGDVVIGLFSVIFLFYTNSFLIKRRKTEFGLYSILGMEKKHIARVLFWENTYVYAVSVIIGLISGVLFSKLMFLVLLKLLRFEVSLGFNIPIQSIIVTFLLFSAIFALIFLNNLRHISFAKPIELLKGGQVGEREPKTRWLLTLIGIVCLGTGYYLALTIESPIVAINLFFVAVILVIIGTYCLFTSGSIALLKGLRKNKKFYYRTNHFINISGMIYRMKQNAVGLANICILSTAVLIMLSTTVSLYIGIEDVLRTRYPRDISLTAYQVAEEDNEMLESMIIEEANSFGADIENATGYSSLSATLFQNENVFSEATDNMLNDVENICVMNLMPLSEYNRLNNDNKTLEDNEALLYILHGEINSDSVVIGGHEYMIKERLHNLTTEGIQSAYIINNYFLIVPDFRSIEVLYSSLSESDDEVKGLDYYLAFDTELGVVEEIALAKSINGRLAGLGITGYTESMEGNRGGIYSLYGGLFFLGIFLGALFIMATVMIIYYKQISEGYDDKERFEIMQKVGLSKSEIKKSIRSQILTVFFLPLAIAVMHIAFAFKIITKLLNLLNLTNITLFAWCTAGTILVFALLYGIVYTLTARVYYKIVS